MADHLSEEEQIEALKRWWKDNGKSTVAAIALLGAGFFGWNQYKDHQIKVAEEGSALYEEFITATTALDVAGDNAPSIESIQALADGIVSHNDSGLYATFAQFQMAKLAVDNKDLEKAKSILQQVTDSAKNEAIKDLARMRLARVEFALGNADAALSLLQVQAGAAYLGAYGELRGDIFLSQKRYDEAHTAYQSALDSITDPRSMRRSLLQLKLDNAAVAQDVVIAPAVEAEAEAEAEPSVETIAAEPKAEDA